MFALTTTSQSLEVLLGGAITTTNPTYVVTYADGTSTTSPAVTVDGSFNGSTAVSALAAPSASHQSMIVSVHVAQKDSVTQTVVVRINDGGSYREFYRASVPAGYSANYERGRGWYTKDTNGADLGVGAAGATGAQGSTGPQGSTGSQGAAGAQGSQGAQGTQGTQGTQGSQGAQGTQGSQGAQGTAATPGGNTTEVQYNNAGTLGGIANVETDGTHLAIVDTTTMPSAIANKVIPFAFDFQDSQIALMLQQPYGIAYPLMPMSPWRRVSWVGMGGGALTSIGAGGSTTGTYSAPSPATTDFRTKSVKGNWATAAGSASSAGLRNTTHHVYLGNASDMGGFLIVGVVANATTVAQQAGWFGVLASASDIGDVDPSGLVTCAGFGYDAAATTWKVMHNDGTGACTVVDLGANYGINTTDVFLMVLSAKPQATVIDYYVKNLATGNATSGQLSTNLPANTTAMWCQLHVGNRTTASAASIQTPGFTIVTDY